MNKIRGQSIGLTLTDQCEPLNLVMRDQIHSRLHLKKNILRLLLGKISMYQENDLEFKNSSGVL